jgi:hypothetical protein
MNGPIILSVLILMIGLASAVLFFYTERYVYVAVGALALWLAFEFEVLEVVRWTFLILWIVAFLLTLLLPLGFVGHVAAVLAFALALGVVIVDASTWAWSEAWDNASDKVGDVFDDDDDDESEDESDAKEECIKNERKTWNERTRECELKVTARDDSEAVDGDVEVEKDGVGELADDIVDMVRVFAVLAQAQDQTSDSTTSTTTSEVPGTTTTSTAAAPVEQAEEPLPPDPNGSVEIVQTTDGSTMALGPTDAYLAEAAFECGGLKNVVWLERQNSALFNAEPLVNAYRARPAYERNDQEFWEAVLGAELFHDLVVAADVNNGFTLEANTFMEEFAARLKHAVPPRPETTLNFTCKGDVIRRNGYLKIGEEGRFAAFAGLVVDKSEFDAALSEAGKTRDELPVFVYNLKNEGGVEQVFVAFKAAGCLNNQLKPPVPPVPVPPTTPTTTVPPTATTTTTTEVPPPDTTVPTATTTVPPNTTVPTETTVPQCSGDKPRWDDLNLNGVVDPGECFPPYQGGTTVPASPTTAAPAVPTTEVTTPEAVIPPSTVAPPVVPPPSTVSPVTPIVV